ncbi:rhamnulokinase [Desertimonas flava]|uniref:rhamnulokinase n=1 Tax=Desertimonas flava TaxID=2064846 RepID=UPI000E35334F|nr:rhamnulokinase family protein [Desertimonas flava]
MTVFAAVDIGASGGRVMAGTVADGRVTLEAMHRFPNGARQADGDPHLRWDFEALSRGVSDGLAKVPGAASIGIDTWAVDYGLLDADGALLADPISYRDDRTAPAIDRVHALIPPDELYRRNGLQFLPFNTIYQLVAEREAGTLARATHAVMIPDLIAHRLTGELATELTNASTTGLVDVHTQQWATGLFDLLGIPPALLPPIRPPGTQRGIVTAGGLAGTPVISVGSHDTASAVVGVPATTERFAYIASGTWSLVGLELPAPVVTDEARAANFTNEIGVGGRTRFLRNVGGLWLLQECMRTWGIDAVDVLVEGAARLPAGGPTIDADDPAFIPPGDMPARIAAAAGRDMDPAGTTRCILDSLAAGYARTLDRARELAGRDVDVIHVVGGGAQNELLCQLTADATGRPVLAGPIEATALGNVLVQAATLGVVADSLEAMRAMAAASTRLRRHDPA